MQNNQLLKTKSMSKMKSMMAMYAMTIAASMQEDNPFRETRHIPTKEELEQRRWVIEQKQLNKKLDGGLKKFYYQGEVIYARNKKNADRKAKNKGLL